MTQPNDQTYNFMRNARGFVDFGGIRIHFGAEPPAAAPQSEEDEIAVKDLSTADLKLVQDGLLGRLKEVTDELGRRSGK